MNILGYSSDKRLGCSVQMRCGGCPEGHLTYEKGLKKKFESQWNLLKTLWKEDLQPPFVTPRSAPRFLRYRGATKLPVKLNSQGQTVIGLYAKNSHDIVETPSCKVQVKVLDRLVNIVREHLQPLGLTPWDEENQKGDIRYIYGRVAHKTEKLLVTFVVSSWDCKPQLQEMTKILRDHGLNLCSVWMNFNNQPGNAVFGQESKKIWGLTRLKENLCGLDVQLGPTSFFQLNPSAAEWLYRRISDLAGKAPHPGATALDLYCGVGITSMLLMKQGWNIWGVEENEGSVTDAQSNIQMNQLPGEAVFYSKKVEDSLKSLPETPLTLVNPSRRGLDISVREAIASRQGRLIYVSCHVETLVRDLTFLQNHGKKVLQIEAMDLFPFTDKLEWICVLT